MKTFEFTRPADAAAAVATAAKAKTAQQGADVRFIAGGTTLVDLMKLSVETPAQLVDINRLPLDKIEATPNGGLKIGATVRNSDLANDATVKRDYSVLSQAILAGRIGTTSQHGDDGRQSCCSARGAFTFAIPRCLATSASRAAVARRSPATIACSRCWARANIASPRIRPICAWPWRRSRRRFTFKGRAVRVPYRDCRFSSLARRHAPSRNSAGTGRPDHACRAAAAESGKQAVLFEAARPSFVRIRAGLGSGRSRNREGQL